MQDNEVHITYEDQEKINCFARNNAKLTYLKEEIKELIVSIQYIFVSQIGFLIVLNFILPPVIRYLCTDFVVTFRKKKKIMLMLLMRL